jgi:hypothetical protein|tara:strand:- start:2027 stop:2248 length:222 start_codon:yes stop_codon:yes gene_type:complete
MSNNRKERNFKYLVWFGDCDYKEYYFEYEKAKKSYNNCIAEGYKDVHLRVLSDKDSMQYKMPEWLSKILEETD